MKNTLAVLLTCGVGLVQALESSPGAPGQPTPQPYERPAVAPLPLPSTAPAQQPPLLQKQPPAQLNQPQPRLPQLEPERSREGRTGDERAP